MKQPGTEPFRYVDSGPAMKSLLGRLGGVRRVALDTEADSLHHYFAKVCLIQLTLNGDHYIVDPLAQNAGLSDLLRVLARKPLILHGADYDLRILRINFRFRPEREVFDTMLAAQLLGYQALGLAALVERFFSVALTKKGQKYDWSRRPLPEEHLKYAVDDTRFLESLADRLEQELRALGREGWHRETCALLVNSTGRDKAPPKPDEVWRVKGWRDLRPKELAFLRALWHWRDTEAQRADLPPFKIMGNATMIQLAVREAACGASASLQGFKLPRHCTGSRLRALRGALRKARELPRARWPEAGARRHPPPPPGPGFEALRKACARKSAELGLDPAVLAPRATLEAIVKSRARSAEAIKACGPMTDWQARLLVPLVQEVLDR